MVPVLRLSALAFLDSWWVQDGAHEQVRDRNSWDDVWRKVNCIHLSIWSTLLTLEIISSIFFFLFWLVPVVQKVLDKKLLHIFLGSFVETSTSSSSLSPAYQLSLRRFLGCGGGRRNQGIIQSSGGCSGYTKSGCDAYSRGQPTCNTPILTLLQQKIKLSNLN